VPESRFSHPHRTPPHATAGFGASVHRYREPGLAAAAGRIREEAQTACANPAWFAQQIVEAFADREIRRYLIRDRDGAYGSEVRRRLKSMNIAEVLTAPKAPRRTVTPSA
jgi:hypothetical protein